MEKSVYLPIVVTDGCNLKEEVNDGEQPKQSEHRARYLNLSFRFRLSNGWWFIAMPVRGPRGSIPSTPPPLMRMLVEVVDAALNWETSHPGQVSTLQPRLTEKVDVINLIPTGADHESRPEGDANEPA